MKVVELIRLLKTLEPESDVCCFDGRTYFEVLAVQSDVESSDEKKPSEIYIDMSTPENINL